MIRRLATFCALLPLVASLLLVSRPASAQPANLPAADQTAEGKPVVGARCRDAGKMVFVVRGIRHDIRSAYARDFVLSPSETWNIVRRVRKDMTLSGHLEASAGGELGTKGISKLLAKLEIEVHASLEVFGKVYIKKMTTVHKRAHNPTKRNREFIAYKGTHNYRGKYTQFFCTKHPVMTHPEWTIRSKGNWRTHQPLEIGTIRCGAGYPTAVSKFVAGRHCG